MLSVRSFGLACEPMAILLDSPSDLAHDIFRYVALRPLSAFDSNQVSTGSDGTLVTTSGTVSVADRNKLNGVILPAPGTQLKDVPTVSGDLLTIARKVIAVKAAGGAVDSETFAKATTAVIRCWLDTKSGRRELRRAKST